MFKKKLLLVLLIISVLAFAGCTAKEKSASADKEAAAEKTAAPEKVYEMRSADVVSTKSPYTIGMTDIFAKKISDGTNGKFKITHFPAGQLGNDQAVVEGVKLGTIDFTTTGYSGVDAALIWNFPYLFDSPEHLQKVLSSDIGADILAHISEEMGVKVIGGAYYPIRHVTCSKPIHSVKDIKGLKIRVPTLPHFVATFEAMGASPTPINFTELFTALQSHTVDAQENPYQLILDNSFYEVQDYCIETGHMYSVRFLLCSNELWDAFTSEEQAVVQDAWQDTADYILETYLENDVSYKEQLIEKGMTFIQPDLASFKEATKDVYKEFIYEPWVEESYKAIRAMVE